MRWSSFSQVVATSATPSSSKKSSSTTSNGPVVPLTAHVAKYAFPSNVAGLKLQPSNPTLLKDARAEVSEWNAPLAKTMNLAIFSAGHPVIAAEVFHPAPSQLAAQYASLVRFVATPGKGDVAVAPHVAQSWRCRRSDDLRRRERC